MEEEQHLFYPYSIPGFHSLNYDPSVHGHMEESSSFQHPEAINHDMQLPNPVEMMFSSLGEQFCEWAASQDSEVFAHMQFTFPVASAMPPPPTPIVPATMFLPPIPVIQATTPRLPMLNIPIAVPLPPSSINPVESSMDSPQSSVHDAGYFSDAGNSNVTPGTTYSQVESLVSQSPPIGNEHTYYNHDGNLAPIIPEGAALGIEIDEVLSLAHVAAAPAGTSRSEPRRLCPEKGCGKSIVARNMKAHRKTHLLRSERELFDCKPCGKNYTRSNDLKQHNERYHP